MSNHFTIYCRTCDACPGWDGINHGSHVIADFYRMRHKLAELYEMDTSGYLEVYVLAHGQALPHFLVEHKDHELVLRDEYGWFYDWEKQERQGNLFADEITGET